MVCLTQARAGRERTSERLRERALEGVVARARDVSAAVEVHKGRHGICAVLAGSV